MMVYFRHMKRRSPSSKILTEIVGDNINLAHNAHHGLIETPLNDFYGHINLDELLVFEAASWDLRRKNNVRFFQLIDSGTIYDVFNYAFDDTFPSLNAHRRIPDKYREAYNKLNPFTRRLRERLGQVDTEAVQTLLERLGQATKDYVSPSAYDTSRETGNLHNMGSDEFFAKAKKTKMDAYAGEIALILRGYPKAYVPLPELPPTRGHTSQHPMLPFQ